MKKINIDGKAVGRGCPAYVIAEIGFNHGGDIKLAVEMIEAAAQAGVDAVKFQTFHASELVLENTGHFNTIKAGELSADDHIILKDAADVNSLTFITTPFDTESIDMLEEIDIPAYKVASMDLTNVPLLRCIARTGKPVIVSTGMASLGEISRAIETIYSEGNEQVILLHCLSRYPSSPEDINLRFMSRLQRIFQCPAGYSDHTLGNATALAAVALGACVIEKHFTTDKSLPGPDHKISADKEEMQQLVRDIRTVEKSLIEWKTISSRPDRDDARNFRRGVYARMDIPAGTVIEQEMIKCVRPEAVITPAQVDVVIGRPARTDIRKDQAIHWGALCK